MELKLGHDIKITMGENKKIYKTTLHLPLWSRGRGGVARVCRGRPSMEVSPLILCTARSSSSRLGLQKVDT